jgi:hypothetical protein
MKSLIRLTFFFLIVLGIVYLNEIWKQPGNTFTEKYQNLVKESEILVQKAKRGEL